MVESRPEILYRRNPVWEALRSGRRVLHGLWLQQDGDRRSRAPLLALAQQRNLPVHYGDRAQLARLAGDGSHQGVVLQVGPYVYSDLEAILGLAEVRDEAPLLLLLDLLHGPQNVGSLLRTAEICGVHGVIMQDRRAPEITPLVSIFSAGAAEHLLIAQVTNLSQAIRRLQDRQVWIAGLDLDPAAQTPEQIDLNRALGLVVGHEGQGLRRRVRGSCDFLLRLPMRGRVESLNAAVAGSIALYQAWQARGFPGARPAAGAGR